MANKFKQGDIVQLKSGGPPMTIDGLPGANAHHQHKPGQYWCTWFKGATRDHGSFGEHLIDTYAPPAK